MKVLVSGAGGLVGRALLPALRKAKHEVAVLARSGASRPEQIFWNPTSGELDLEKLDQWKGPEAVVHLAGEGIANGRWTEERKKRIRESRVQATERLSASLLKLRYPPSTLVSASAIGFYGDRGEEILTEQSSHGSGFLSEVVIGWEQAAAKLRDTGVRVVHLRFGMILSAKGGALRKMLLPFRMGLGGPLAAGEQWMSWIGLDDAIRLILFVLEGKELSGVFNGVSPEPIRNKQFTKDLARVLGRPALFRVPAFMLQLAFGSEMADELLLSSQRVLPERLTASGFRFQDENLAQTLRQELRSGRGQ